MANYLEPDSGNPLKGFAIAFLIMIAATFIAFTLSRCGKTNKEPHRTDIIELIENKSQTDEIEKKVRIMNDSISVSKTKIDQSKVSVNKAKQVAQKKTTEIQKAIESADTIAIIKGYEEQTKSYQDYIFEQEKQLNLQSELILKKDTFITYLYAQIELNKSREKIYSATIYELNNEVALKDKILKKSERRRKSAKLLNKIAVPVAIVAVTIAMVSY